MVESMGDSHASSIRRKWIHFDFVSKPKKAGCAKNGETIFTGLNICLLYPGVKRQSLDPVPPGIVVRALWQGNRRRPGDE